ncbi:MAG TPA: hypothetical protein VNE38_18760 [Ktedonobacteraceae bacterium]|nr:hypothetical protein [Ktedonobacteraceae bacterium]
MIYRTDKVIEGPWIRLSLNVFLDKARASQADMKAMLDSIVYARDVFQSARILPSQGDRIANALHMIQTAVLDLLNLTARMPESLSPSRFSLVRNIYKVDALLNDLILLIPPSRPGSPTSSYDAVHQRREIQREFSLLVQAFEDMLRELSLLLDKAHFLKRH